MPVPPILLNAGDIIQMRMVTTSQKQFAFNIRHFQVASLSAGGAQTLQGLLEAVDEVVAPRLRNLVSPEALYEGMGMRRLLSFIGPATLEVHTVARQGVGTSVGDVLPRQACGIATLYTIRPGRRYRGRIYLPFPGEGDNSADGTPTSAYLARVRDLMDVLAGTVVFVLPGAIGNVTLKPSILHRSAGTVDDVTHYQERDRWATQRRRGDFGKLNADPWL